MSHERKPASGGVKETARLETFSDGVFAIAITLLVLELISILHPQNGESLYNFYLHHWQPFVAFIIGFLTIMVCWINHSHVFDYIKKTNSSLPWVNGFVLLMITFAPFPTAILAEYLGKESRFALTIFGFNYIMISFASYFLCAYSYKKHLIDSEDRAFFHCVKLTYVYSILYTLFAFAVCFLSVPIAVILYMLLFYAFAFPKEFATRIYKRRQKKISAK
jgi:uncharacterized membrane protein